MVISPSNRRLQLTYYIILVVLGVSGGILYYIQNYSHGLGGGIALPKVLWLALALWFWYFLPPLIGTDARINPQLRQGYWILWLNMVVRAVLELWMMYGSQTWHPYYGIGHDLVSALLIFSWLFKLDLDQDSPVPENTFPSAKVNVEKHPINSLDKAVRFNFRVMGVMFWIESYFAWYMLKNVHLGDEPVYFVPASSQHQGIMLITWAVVIGLMIQQLIFARKWLYEPIERGSGAETATPG
ncbi:MAG: hypothetical protein KME06_17490 [Kastovskya adunca ATA6-11-RM4]|jgi:hypothetical protein|nr:hypothetical protein [Kastovskya adunca ATA6-11-RM4]